MQSTLEIVVRSISDIYQQSGRDRMSSTETRFNLNVVYAFEYLLDIQVDHC